jgi:hypothetical protein
VASQNGWRCTSQCRGGARRGCFHNLGVAADLRNLVTTEIFWAARHSHGIATHTQRRDRETWLLSPRLPRVTSPRVRQRASQVPCRVASERDSHDALPTTLQLTVFPSLDSFPFPPRRREDLQDQVRAVPRRGGGGRAQAGTFFVCLCDTGRHYTRRQTLEESARTTRTRALIRGRETERKPARSFPGHCSAFTAVSSRRKRFLFFQSFRVAPILTPHPPPHPQPGPQPGRPFRPRQRHNGGVRVQRREQKQRRQVGNRHPLRLPVEPEEVHPGNEDGFRGAEKTAGQGRPHRVPRR